MHKKKQAGPSGGTNNTDSMMDQRMDMKSIMKDIEFLGNSRMTWKERKELENRKVVSLGGKPQKKQRLPLSVARPAMKNQKKRDQKMSEENSILGRFGGKYGAGTKKVVDRRRPEDRVLRASEGYFKNGVLDVKHLLRPGSSRDSNTSAPADKGYQKKGSGKKGGGKNKGGGKKHGNPKLGI